MELAFITSKQVLELFILIFAGIVLYKKHIVKSEHKGVLSSILIDFVVPCMVINSFMGKSIDNAGELGKSFIYSIILCVIGIVIALLTGLFIKKDLRDVYNFACSFSNAAYMGFPLINAMFSDVGIMYASAYVTVFNILLWTVGYMFFASVKHPKDIFLAIVKCPPIISVGIGLIIYFGNIQITDIIAQPISMVGAMNTPLSMIITGVTVAQTNVRNILKNVYLWFAVFVRLIVIPGVCTLVFSLLHFTGMTAMVCLVLEACPVAAITTMLAVQYNKNQEYAAGLVVMSTLFSIISLPVYAMVVQLCGLY